MPALNIQKPGMAAVTEFGTLLEGLLTEAASKKATATIEPALIKADFEGLAKRVALAIALPKSEATDEKAETPAESSTNQQFAVIETAARDVFDDLIATTLIETPEFVKMWNLLDVLSILSDDDQCDPALLFWLVEELLDSQTIAGCRIVFDYLESRRERITAKHFKQKQLVILRSCNELLRRLSRAEDTAFCGRVFIFMFQSFPLGDRSSVNLRGEYHVENITAYEDAASNLDTRQETRDMDLDQPAGTPASVNGDIGAGSKSSSVALEVKEDGKVYDPDSLYPQFWSLQESFSQPLKLFDAAHFGNFKSSLEETLKAFKAIHYTESPQSARSLETSRIDLKRKREEDGLGPGLETFNPKYLTSKDLFELEVSDLSFRRHVLVQALIITDFLLSLSADAKEKRANVTASNKSVMYSDQLSEENTKWAVEMKSKISDYLKKGFDGPYFYRMVETVLARDKNWVFWKMASCPPIQRQPVTPKIFVEARATAQRMATSKRLRPTPMGSVSLDFLRDQGEESPLEELKAPERYQLPGLDSFERKIADDDFEIGMPSNEQAKAIAIAGKASKSWRALRIAGRNKLVAFDKIDDPDKVDAVFKELPDEDPENEDDEDAAAAYEDMPLVREPVIIAGHKGVGKTALIARLQQLHKGVFAAVVRHTTREPNDAETKGKSFHFVKPAEFNQLRDGDKLVEYGTRNDADYGTSSKAVEAVTEAGKVPIIELDVEAAQLAKDMDFAARYVLVKPPSSEALKDRLTQSAVDDDIAETITKEFEGTDAAKMNELFDETISNDELDKAALELGSYLYGKDNSSPCLDTEVQDVSADNDPETESATVEPTEGDENMEDAGGGQGGKEATIEAE